MTPIAHRSEPEWKDGRVMRRKAESRTSHENGAIRSTISGKVAESSTDFWGSPSQTAQKRKAN